MPPTHNKTWRIDVHLLGAHSHVAVRHGVEGQRALLGTLVCDEDEVMELIEMFRAAGCELAHGDPRAQLEGKAS